MAFSDGGIRAIERRRAATHALLLNWAGQLEADAKTNAPWFDRTAHARQGLHGGVDNLGTEYHLYLAHSMEYGVWLEIACKPKSQRSSSQNQPGPYAIILPTLDAYQSRIRKSIIDLWS